MTSGIDVVCVAWFADTKLGILPDDFTLTVAKAIWPLILIPGAGEWTTWWQTQPSDGPWYAVVRRVAREMDL